MYNKMKCDGNFDVFMELYNKKLNGCYMNYDEIAKYIMLIDIYFMEG